MLVSDMPAWIVRALAFVFGALWGSFFNVAIYRWPRELSVVSPPSHCPHCKTEIPPYRNIPILGWLMLRGKTACCGQKLSPRYVLVEATSALLAVALAERFILAQDANASLSDAAITTLLFFFFVGGLLIATFVDAEWMEIPDEVSIGGAALGLATVALRHPSPDAVDLALGAGGGFLTVQVLLVWSWERLTGRRGMGEGDSKFLMFIGAFLGWKGAIFALVGGALQGMIYALVSGVASRARPEPPRPTPATETDGEALADEDHWVPPAPLEGRDGTKATLSDGGRQLTVEDAKGRTLWEHVAVDPDADPMRRAIPFGPFLALGALEFLFFGDRLIEAYLDLFL
ncbi:MAG: prepilin peptidase [Sandaracinaceae bacterium]|nr:prepilin peptidase [Sandaracinaceae bacterium]